VALALEEFLLRHYVLVLRVALALALDGDSSL
jgi:hypothetical protein